MSFDNPEYDLLAAFKARFGISDENQRDSDLPPDTGVLSSAQYIYDNAVDVALSMQGTKAAARSIYELMKSSPYSMQSWNAHELQPTPSLGGGPEESVKFIFTVDLLNFSFWCPGEEKYSVDYNGKTWTGYYSLVAAMRRAMDEGVPITSSDFWQNEDEATDDALRRVFRSNTNAEIPLLDERMRCLREAGHILYEKYQCSPLNLLRKARSSARRLVHLLVTDFRNLFHDVAYYPPDSKDPQDLVRFHKRAQIFAADLWICFNAPHLSGNTTSSAGDESELMREVRTLTDFDDIDHLTIFADYRIPQMLNYLGATEYSPVLTSRIAHGEMLENGGAWEVEIRGCAVWGVEMLRRQIVELQQQDRESATVQPQEEPTSTHPTYKSKINAVLIDYFLYDLCKEMERNRELEPDEVLQHHRTRSIWY